MKKCLACNANYPTDYTHCPRDGTSLIEVGIWSEGMVVREKYRILDQIGARRANRAYEKREWHGIQQHHAIED